MIESWRGVSPTIDPTAWVHPSAVVIGDVVIGPRATVWPTAVLRGDMNPIRIGADTTLQDGVIVHTTDDLSVVTVGDRVTVGHRAILHGCIVEDDCLVGMGSIVLDNAVIGAGSLVAAGALVAGRAQIPPGSLVMGNPGRVVRALRERDREAIGHGWKIYAAYGAELSGRSS